MHNITRILADDGILNLKLKCECFYNILDIDASSLPKEGPISDDLHIRIVNRINILQYIARNTPVNDSNITARVEYVTFLLQEHIGTKIQEQNYRQGKTSNLIRTYRHDCQQFPEYCINSICSLLKQINNENFRDLSTTYENLKTRMDRAKRQPKPNPRYKDFVRVDDTASTEESLEQSTSNASKQLTTAPSSTTRNQGHSSDTEEIQAQKESQNKPPQTRKRGRKPANKNVTNIETNSQATTVTLSQSSTTPLSQTIQNTANQQQQQHMRTRASSAASLNKETTENVSIMQEKANLVEDALAQARAIASDDDTTTTDTESNTSKQQHDESDNQSTTSGTSSSGTTVELGSDLSRSRRSSSSTRSSSASSDKASSTRSSPERRTSSPRALSLAGSVQGPYRDPTRRTNVRATMTVTPSTSTPATKSTQIERAVPTNAPRTSTPKSPQPGTSKQSESTNIDLNSLKTELQTKQDELTELTTMITNGTLSVRQEAIKNMLIQLDKQIKLIQDKIGSSQATAPSNVSTNLSIVSVARKEDTLGSMDGTVREVLKQYAYTKQGIKTIVPRSNVASRKRSISDLSPKGTAMQTAKKSKRVPGYITKASGVREDGYDEIKSIIDHDKEHGLEILIIVFTSSTEKNKEDATYKLLIREAIKFGWKPLKKYLNALSMTRIRKLAKNYPLLHEISEAKTYEDLDKNKMKAIDAKEHQDNEDRRKKHAEYVKRKRSNAGKEA